MLGRIKKLPSKIMFIFSAPRCVSCRSRLDIDDKAICKNCLEKYEKSKNRNCSVCAKILSECICPPYYLKAHFVTELSKLVRYNTGEGSEVSSRIIYRMKKKQRADVTGFMADELTNALLKTHADLPPDALVTNVPNRKRAISERGFDHAEVLAKSVAKNLNLEFKHLLISKAKKPQKSMTHLERRKNAQFDLIGEPDLKGRTVIIVDDVVTSGASMGNSATMIKSLRPKKIIGITVAIAYKDDKIGKSE